MVGHFDAAHQNEHMKHQFPEAPIPLSSFAGEPSQNVGKSFLKSYAAVCLEGAVIVLACIIFSVFASSPPTVDPDAAAASMVWSY